MPVRFPTDSGRRGPASVGFSLNHETLSTHSETATAWHKTRDQRGADNPIRYRGGWYQIITSSDCGENVRRYDKYYERWCVDTETGPEGWRCCRGLAESGKSVFLTDPGERKWNWEWTLYLGICIFAGYCLLKYMYNSCSVLSWVQSNNESNNIIKSTRKDTRQKLNYTTTIQRWQ